MIFIIAAAILSFLMGYSYGRQSAEEENELSKPLTPEEIRKLEELNKEFERINMEFINKLDEVVKKELKNKK
jgi:hypothetical protein